MAFEIERKFLVMGNAWRDGRSGTPIAQGYMPVEQGIVRVRIAGDQAYLTIKGRGLMTRREFEYPIPLPDASELLEHFCGSRTVVKTRYEVPIGSHVFSVDIFHEENEGLVMAEVELSSENEELELPEWIGHEVTRDPRYHNSNLLLYPYREWHAEPPTA